MHRLFQLQVEKGKVRLLGGAPHPREIILVGIAEFHQCEQHGVSAGFFGRTALLMTALSLGGYFLMYWLVDRKLNLN